MAALQRFAYSPTGSSLVLADGAEVLVHAGDDESPRWRRALDEEVAAVGATDDAVVALTASGKLAFWREADGEPIGEVALAAAPGALAVGPGAVCAVALGEEVTVVGQDGARRALPIAGATALAWSGDGGRIAAGNGEGRVQVLSAEDGAVIGSAELGVPVRSLAWNAGGFWIAAGGEQVFRLDEGGGEYAQMTRAPGMAPDCVACSADGALVALRLGPTRVLALVLPSKDTAATVEYVDREVVGIGFGPAPYLGIGLDRGDANKIDLRTQAVHRTDPHPGRPRTRWLLSVSIDPTSLPPAHGAPPGAAAGAEREPPLPATHAAVQRAVAVALAIVAVVILLSRFG